MAIISNSAGKARFTDVILSYFKENLDFRFEGFLQIFLALENMGREYQTIVETGCSRKVVGDGVVYGQPVPEEHPWYPGGTQGPWADGQSTMLFDRFLGQHRGHLYTIDIDDVNCSVARAATSDSVSVVSGDSVCTFGKLDRLIGAGNSIDCLYLDSFDLDWDHPHESALHHIKELAAANRYLYTGSIVAVDDSLNAGRRGKGLYVAEYMTAVGAELLFDGYQSVWRL